MRNHGGDTKRRDGLRRLLDSQRNDLHARLRALRETLPAEGSPVRDTEEQSLDDLALDLDVVLVQIEAASVESIAEALRRLDEGRYGVCADCGGRIPAARLEAVPSALRCLQCQEAEEAREVPSGEAQEWS